MGYFEGLAVLPRGLREQDSLHEDIAPLGHSREATGYISPCALSRRTLTYQSHTLGLIVFGVIGNISVWHPLGDHGEWRIRSIVPAADPDESQDVRVVQRFP